MGLRLALPDGSAAEPEAELPTIDLSSVRGAAIALRRGFLGEGGVGLRALCATAPSDRWAPGVEDLLLGRVNAITQGALGGEPLRFDAGEIAREGSRFEQRFTGEVRRAEVARFSVQGRHVLGFAGEAKAAVLCTVLCVEPAAPEGRCAELVDASRPEGTFTEAPPASLLIRAILFSAERPEAALGTGGAVALALIVWVLAKRPKPRW